MKKPKYFRKDTGIKSLNIQGKEFFSSLGNSYNSVYVAVNEGYKNEFFFTLPIEYGYGSDYRERVVAALISMGVVSSTQAYMNITCKDKFV